MGIYNDIDSRVYFYILGLEYECYPDQWHENYMLEAVCMAKGHRLGGTTIMLDQAQFEYYTSKESEE
jgi:hypothetical protein|tara:strand:+ start:84 stop:284 length:201 start_codon:yes stop_codon:yes gene_type:complete